jgi:hypothetical protein
LLGEEGTEGGKRGRRKALEEREMRNILVVYEFAEELQCSAKLLSTVTPHHFAELVVEADGECFLWFGSTNKPKGLFVEPTVNALSQLTLRNEEISLVGPRGCGHPKPPLGWFRPFPWLHGVAEPPLGAQGGGWWTWLVDVVTPSFFFF